jgi:hypothetical protein
MLTEKMKNLFNSYFKGNTFSQEEITTNILKISNEIYNVFELNNQEANNIMGFDMGKSTTVDDITFWTLNRFSLYLQEKK